MPEHVLLSTVGISDYSETRFVLEDGDETSAKLAPVALARLLDIDALLLAHTPEVREETAHIERVREACDATDVAVRTVEVDLIRGQADVDRLLDDVTSALVESDTRAVTLDICHAYRSLQLALYTATIQLDALDVVDIEGLYYAEEAGGGGTTRLLDLTYLHTLMEWHHALRTDCCTPVTGVMSTGSIQTCATRCAR